MLTLPSAAAPGTMVASAQLVLSPDDSQLAAVFQLPVPLLLKKSFASATMVKVAVISVPSLALNEPPPPPVNAFFLRPEF